MTSLPPDWFYWGTLQDRASKDVNELSISRTLSSPAPTMDSPSLMDWAKMHLSNPAFAPSPRSTTSDPVELDDSFANTQCSSVFDDEASKDHDENDIATPATTVGTPQSSPVASSKPTDNTFAGAVRIPACSPDIFVYPQASSSINSAFHGRFRTVIDIFRQNAEAHPQLRDHVRHIDYVLRLCGPSPENAHPSILVICRDSEFAALKSILTNKRLKYQYALRRSSSLIPWMKRRGNNGGSSAIDAHRPLFNLYFWRQQTPRTFLWGLTQAISREELGDESNTTHSSVSELTLCGTRLIWSQSPERTSTIGCVIQIGTEYYGLTAAHASARLCDERLERIELPRDEHLGVPSPGESDFDDYVMDEITYDDPAVEEASDEDLSHENFSDTKAPKYDSTFELHIPEPQTSSILVPFERMRLEARFPSDGELLSNGHMDLDWALVHLSDPGDWRPNAFQDSADDSGTAILLSHYSTKPEVDTPIFILSSEKTLRGTLQSSVSILGGINGSAKSELWTVIPALGNEPIKGSSGALVVDAVTHCIYGHVVAVNPLGEVYISPLYAVIQQLNRIFPTSTVTLPPPRKMLANLASHHAECGALTTSRRLLSHLTALYAEDDRPTLTEQAQILLDKHDREYWTESEVLKNSTERVAKHLPDQGNAASGASRHTPRGNDYPHQSLSTFSVPKTQGATIARPNSQAEACLAEGKAEEAVRILEQVVASQSGLPQDDPDRLTSQYELARAHLANKQAAEAVRLLQHVVFMETRLPVNDPNRLSTQHELARAYLANGQAEESISLLEYVISISKKDKSTPEPDLLSSQHELGRAYIATGRIQDAVNILEHVVSREAKLAEDDSSRLASEHELARAYLASKKTWEAVGLLEHVVDMQDELPASHPARIASQYQLGRAYIQNGQAEKAVSLLKHVVSMEKKLSKKDPDRLASRRELDRAQDESEQMTDAMGLLGHLVSISGGLGGSSPCRLASSQEPGRSSRSPSLGHLVSRQGSQLSKRVGREKSSWLVSDRSIKEEEKRRRVDT